MGIPIMEIRWLYHGNSYMTKIRYLYWGSMDTDYNSYLVPTFIVLLNLFFSVAILNNSN